MNLSKKDYEKIIYFMNCTHLTTSNLTKTVQIQLSELFNLNHSLFWLADKQSNMYNLEFYNHEDKLIWDYTETYKNEDIMHPKKQLPNVTYKNKGVLGFQDITTPTAFKKSEYSNFFWEAPNDWSNGYLLYR